MPEACEFTDVTETISAGLSRRQMVVAGAWTVPAIMLATASPAFAGSPGETKFTVTIDKVQPKYWADGKVSNTGSAITFFHIVASVKNTGSTSLSNIKCTFTVSKPTDAPGWNSPIRTPTVGVGATKEITAEYPQDDSKTPLKPGTYDFTVTAISNGVTETATKSVTVPDIP